MRTLQIAVIEIAGSWCILLNGERIGRFARRADAIRCAWEAAGSASAGQGNVPVELLVQDECGQITALPLETAAGPLNA